MYIVILTYQILYDYRLLTCCYYRHKGINTLFTYLNTDTMWWLHGWCSYSIALTAIIDKGTRETVTEGVPKAVAEELPAYLHCVTMMRASQQR